MATVQKLFKANVLKGGEVYTNVGGVGLANGDQSVAIDLGHVLSAKSWQVTGTFGAAGSVQLEGSNDGATWVIVGSAVTAAGLVNVQIDSRFLRFNVTAGDGTTSLFVTLIARATRGS